MSENNKKEEDKPCPKCGAKLIKVVTRSGKKLTKCSTAGWDKEKRQPTGCDYVEWFNGSREELDETCPKCDQKLVLVVTAKGKRMKKCSTNQWDREKKQAIGCDYVEWLNDNKPSNINQNESNGDENFPAYEV